MTMRIRFQFDGKVMVPVDPVDLPTGTVLEADVHDPNEPPRGSPAALLKAMREPPHLSKEDIEEFERAIEEGKLPVRYEGIFDDEDENRG